MKVPELCALEVQISEIHIVDDLQVDLRKLTNKKQQCYNENDEHQLQHSSLLNFK